MNTRMFDYINASPTAIQAVDTLAARLDKEGYVRLYEGEKWELSEKGKYYVIRNGTSLIAFRYKSSAKGFAVASSHTDSPTFKIKENAESIGVCTRLEVEKYGGSIFYSWLDRPLSVAGRVFVKTENGIQAVSVNVDRDLLCIPSLCIHLNPGVNDGAKLDMKTDMLPLFSGEKEKGGFIKTVAEAAGVKEEDILSHDLFLYNRQKGITYGKNNEFILCPRLDDLACVFATAEAFLSADDGNVFPVLAVFDNEEVGSSTKQGAASTFLCATLKNACGAAYDAMLPSSYMISADNAQALHPAHPELSDRDHAPVLNGGVVVKYNASQQYATDGPSAAIFNVLCERAGIKPQIYHTRADMRGGSTLGSISNVAFSVPTVDIGLAQLSMHSSTETIGANDVEQMVKVVKELYSSSLDFKGNNVKM